MKIDPLPHSLFSRTLSLPYALIHFKLLTLSFLMARIMSSSLTGSDLLPLLRMTAALSAPSSNMPPLMGLGEERRKSCQERVCACVCCVKMYVCF